MKRTFNKQQDSEVSIKEPPITLKKYKKTMRVLFGRRSNMKERPVIVFSFEGIIGDIYKANFWSREGTSFYIRPFAAKALKLLYQYFQIVIYIGKPYDKKRIDRVKDWILKIGTPIDGFYVSTRKEQVQIDDFSQIYLDFQQGDQTRISQKLLYIGSLNIDAEEIQQREGSELLFSDQRTLKTFQESSFLTTQVDLIASTNIPFTLDTETSQQPLVLLIPNPRNSSNGIFITMLAIAKMIFSLAMVSVQRFDNISLKNLNDNNVFIKRNILNFEMGDRRKKRIQSANRVGQIYGNPRTQRIITDDLNSNFTMCQSTQNSFIMNKSPYTDVESDAETTIMQNLNENFFMNINWLQGFETASESQLFGFKPIQTTDVLDIVKRQKLKILEVEREREDRRSDCKQVTEDSISRLSVVMNMVCNIVKESKLSYNPMSSMVNRNVRFFERARLRKKDKNEEVFRFKNDDFENLDCQLSNTSGLSRFLVYSPLQTSAFKSGSNNMLSKGYELVEQDQCTSFNVASWFNNPKPIGKKVHIELPSEKVNGSLF